MNYIETIEHLYSQLPMYSRIGAAAYKNDLHNTIALCNSIHNPQQQYKIVHIAGTNGKGSTSHMLAAILQAAGYKVGLYTSPHIKDFRERIRVNGIMITEEAIVNFVALTNTITTQIQPSFFELTVAMAFAYFAAEKVDIAIIETGLGGLLDSTNIVLPILSVITNIGYDHQNILGNSLVEIAIQKAGIIKQNVPVVIGEAIPETKPIFIQTAMLKNADIFFVKDSYAVQNVQYTPHSLVCEVSEIATCKHKTYTVGLTGLYQAKNICTVLAVVEQLNNIGVHISPIAVQNGLQQVKQTTGLRGRWDLLQTNPTLIADVAHNKDGILQVMQQLTIYYPLATLHFVLGFVNDKDVLSILQLLPANAHYYFTNAHIPRAMPSADLASIGSSVQREGQVYNDVNMAIAAAKEQAELTDVIMVCGSFFLIAEIDNF